MSTFQEKSLLLSVGERWHDIHVELRAVGIRKNPAAPALFDGLRHSFGSAIGFDFMAKELFQVELGQIALRELFEFAYRIDIILLGVIDWPRSNPKGYGEWFKSRMAVVLARRKQDLVESLRRRGVAASVEQLPDFRVRTPLQAAVMILKRHRDKMFALETDLKPISVIITTLSGHAYGQEDTISGALFSILDRMDQYIQHDGRRYIIPNPTDPFENFADKWEKNPLKAEAFFRWLKQAREDFGRAARAMTLQGMNEAVSARMGTALSDRAVRRVGGSGGLLRAVSTAPVAPVAAVPSFGNAARVPTTPKGFA